MRARTAAQLVEGRFEGAGAEMYGGGGTLPVRTAEQGCMRARTAAQLVEGRFEGAGAETYGGGGMYQGGFAGGRRAGLGACHFGSGDYYEGEWLDGLRHGRGMQQCMDNSNFVRAPWLCRSHAEPLTGKSMDAEPEYASERRSCALMATSSCKEDSLSCYKLGYSCSKSMCAGRWGSLARASATGQACMPSRKATDIRHVI